MQANRRTDTKPEIRLRSALHRRGFRFRKDFRITAGEVKVKPDIVFTRRRVAVFVDGCFWHNCPVHGRTPSVNGWYWSPKLQRNADRDERVTAALRADHWLVLRFWEHEALDDVVATVAQVLQAEVLPAGVLQDDAAGAVEA
jgi:DNA mismatch endonuclease (patch repair protein)